MVIMQLSDIAAINVSMIKIVFKTSAIAEKEAANWNTFAAMKTCVFSSRFTCRDILVAHDASKLFA